MPQLLAGLHDCLPAGRWPCLEDQHSLGAVGRQAVGEHTAGSAASHDDIVIFLALCGGGLLAEELR